MTDEKRGMKILDLDNDFNASQERLAELKAGRLEVDIPLDDKYWVALNKHRQAYGSK